MVHGGAHQQKGLNKYSRQSLQLFRLWYMAVPTSRRVWRLKEPPAKPADLRRPAGFNAQASATPKASRRLHRAPTRRTRYCSRPHLRLRRCFALLSWGRRLCLHDSLDHLRGGRRGLAFGLLHLLVLLIVLLAGLGLFFGNLLTLGQSHILGLRQGPRRHVAEQFFLVLPLALRLRHPLLRSAVPRFLRVEVRGQLVARRRCLRKCLLGLVPLLR